MVSIRLFIPLSRLFWPAVGPEQIAVLKILLASADPKLL